MFDDPAWRKETARELTYRYMQLKDRSAQSPKDYAEDYYKAFNEILKALLHAWQTRQ